MYSDQELVSMAMSGDEQAFAEIIELYQHSVYNLTYRMLNDAREAEDAAQETFLRAYRNLHRYDSNRSFKTWLLSIASNYCIDLIRRWRKLSWLSIDDLLPSLELTSPEPTPEDMTIRKERQNTLQNLLEKLAPDYRAAVVMYYWYDMPCQEIAEALNTSESAIKSRLFRARQTMADQLRETALVVPGFNFRLEAAV
jgi:RNA polymerase sigma-70 factor, ECF subfamily